MVQLHLAGCACDRGPFPSFTDFLGFQDGSGILVRQFGAFLAGGGRKSAEFSSKRVLEDGDQNGAGVGGYFLSLEYRPTDDFDDCHFLL